MITKRIVAGKYKQKIINLPSSDTTRSTKSIIKESLFDTLQFDVVGQDFVEVFGGSGSMGLEALSRGARHAYFFEKDKKAFGCLKENCDRIAKDDTSCTLGDSFEEFPKWLKRLTQKTYFYFDPPFSFRDGMEDVYTHTIGLIALIPPSLSHRIIVEHMSKLKMPESIKNYKIIKTKKFGKSALTYYDS